MDEEFQIEWADGSGGGNSGTSSYGHQIICESHSDDLIEENNDIEEGEEYLVGEEIIPSTEIITMSNSLDQIAAENLIYMAQDGSVTVMGDLIEEQVDQVDNADYNEQQYFECQVTEEVITDDWVQQQGEDRVEVPVDQLVSDAQNEEVMVPLPTDEYTTLRPYPCDFCSRRFRKKTNLMNHMVAHKNDRPNNCNLCGARYIRKIDLINHLKVHAQMPDPDMEYIDIVKRSAGTTSINNTQVGDEESLLTVMNTRVESSSKSEPRQRKKTVATVSAPQPKKQIKSGGVAGKKLPQSQKLRYTSSNNYDEYGDPLLPDQLTSAATDAGRPFVCQVCGVGFAREKALKSHVLLHGVSNALECETCSEVFWSIDSLQKHQKTHFVEGETSGSEYEPDDDKTASDDDFDPKYGEYYCNVCGMAFHRGDLLKRHMRTHDNKSETGNAHENYCCNVCGNTFAEALDLLAHAEIHTRATVQKCTLCGETFMQEDAIRDHILSVHASELTESTCRLCGKHCKDERTLMKHSWDHSKEKNHSCLKCGKTFYNKARLKRHMQSHRNKSVACDVCGEYFPDGRSLMNHRHSHTNVSGRQFPCRECGKTFGSRSSQQIHMRIHTGERPYGCRFCWKAFADGGTLRKHERIHTGEKPYACPVCPRAFNQRVVLREHIRSHHSAPDPNYEDSIMPFYCTVCGNLFKTATEIIQHLIEHSDANTVSKRQPIVGPRKYKRRRKLKPEELETFRKGKNDVSKSPTKSPTKRTSSRKRGLSERDDYYSNDDMDDSQNYDDDDQGEMAYETHSMSKIVQSDEMDNISIDDDQTTLLSAESAVSVFSSGAGNDYHDEPVITPAKSSRKKSPSKKMQTVAVYSSVDRKSSVTAAAPKSQRQARMIHTSKQKVTTVAKDGRTVAKTKTIVAPTTNSAKKATKSALAANLEEIPRSPMKEAATESARPKRSTNTRGGMLRVDYTNSAPSTSTAAGNLNDSMHADSKPATRSSKRLSNRIIDEIPPKASKTSTASPSKSSARRAHVKSTVADIDPLDNFDEDDESNVQRLPVILNIKQEKEVSYTMTDESSLFTCEICSAVFSDRAQLLMHVPVHI